MEPNPNVLTDEEKVLRQAIIEATPKLIKNATEQPPTIAVIGVAGVGKTSTINALFKTKLYVSHTTVGTKIANLVRLKNTSKDQGSKNIKIDLQVYDFPGLGEDIEKDKTYLDDQRKSLEQCDVILWVREARDRRPAAEQGYLKELKEYQHKILFGLNKVDEVHPNNWDTEVNLPSEEQKKIIDELVENNKEHLLSVFDKKLQDKVRFVPYSTKKGWNLQILFEAFIYTCPPERAWIFGQLKNFSYKDFVPDNLLLEETGEKKSELTIKQQVKPKLSTKQVRRSKEYQKVQKKSEKNTLNRIWEGLAIVIGAGVELFRKAKNKVSNWFSDIFS